MSSDNNSPSDNEKCSICLQPFNLPVKLECTHRFCFLCVKNIIEKTFQNKCPLCRRDDVLVSDKDLMIDEDAFEQQVVECDEHVWQYSGRNSGWWNYDPVLSYQIDRYYRCYTGEIEGEGESSDQQPDAKYQINIGTDTYTIDFDAMLQYPDMYPDRQRKIRRIKCEEVDKDSKGTAGLEKFYVKKKN